MRFPNILPVAAFLLLAACASTDSVADEPLRSGAQMDFPAPYDRVTRAATAALFDVQMPIAKITAQNGGTIILVAQRLNIMDNSEVGRIFVTPNTTVGGAGVTSVYAAVEHRMTGQHDHAFAAPYFAAVQAELNKR